MNYRFITFILIILVFLGFAYPSVSLAEEGFSAVEISKSAQVLKMKPKSALTLEVKYKNTGKKTWLNSGNNYLEIVTADPVKRESPFVHKYWEKPYVAGKLVEKQVKPGEIGTFKIALQAPDKEGFYLEKFTGVAKGLAWVDGMNLEIPIYVKSKDDVVVASAKVDTGKEIAEGSLKYAARELIRSGEGLTVAPGSLISFSVGFKNIGQKEWNFNSKDYVSLYTIEPKYRQSLFYDEKSWAHPFQVKFVQETVKPGSIGYFNFFIKAPLKTGVYKEAFQLAVENKSWIEGGRFELQVIVKNPEDVVLVSENNFDGEELAGLALNRINEPVIRIGLFWVEEILVFSSDEPFTVQDKDKNIVMQFKEKEICSISYDSKTKKYKLSYNGQEITYDSQLMVVPEKEDGLLKIVNRDSRAEWNTALNHDKFRGILEIRYNDYKDRVWLINELKIEDYLMGIVEVSNNAPHEFLKSMVIAARSYALYHYLRDTKHPKEFFHIDSYYDQVYKGYTVETYLPNWVQAVKDTEGMVVTYNNELAVTPYFSQSDGRTRSWKEVWKNEIPWCQSVEDPYNQGKKLLGHGVGLSTRGAWLMAKYENKTCEQILKYYYKGIEIKKYY